MKKVLLINDKDPIDIALFMPKKDDYVLSIYQYPYDKFHLKQGLERHKDTQVLITPYMNLCAKNLRRLPELEVIITLSTAIEFIDLDYCKEQGIDVINNAGYSGSAVAEHAFALMLALARHLNLLDRQARRGGFMTFDHQGTELDGKRLGIVGFGHIGKKLARMAQGFNMDVVYFNRSMIENVEGARAVSKVELLTTADVIALTLPLTDQTWHLIDASAFDVMKKSAMIVSISPDEIIDLNALKQQLHDDAIGGAALDLHSPRPDLNDLDNLIVTPTRAYYTKECVIRRDESCLRTLQKTIRTL